MSINGIITSALSGGYGYSATLRHAARSPEKGSGAQALDDESKREVEKLKKTDQDVKTHEQAHMSAGGQHVRGGASFEYQTGPDGRRYAVGGEVSIDTSPVKGDPAATIRKMQAVRSAALAPANPSSQDRAVAAAAAGAAAQAAADLAQMHQAASGGDPKSGNNTDKESAGKNAPVSMYSMKGLSRENSAATGLLLNIFA